MHRLLLAALILAIPLSGALAQADPSRPVIVLFEPGRGMDWVARVVIHLLSALQVPIVVDNRPGGNGASRANPDGYTPMIGGASMWPIRIS